MSTYLALALAAGPTALAFVFLGIGNAKRRRTAGEPPASPLSRWIGTGLIVFSGLLVLITAGAVAFLIWISALGAIGWALANGVVTAATWSRGSGQGGLAWAFRHGAEPCDESRSSAKLWATGPVGSRLIARSREGLRAVRAKPAGLLAAAAAMSAVLCLVSMVAALWSVEKSSRGTKQLLALQTVAALVQDRSTAAASPCLAAFDGRVDASQALRDLLSGRAFSLSVPRGAVSTAVGINLQQCIAAAGGDEITVEADEGRKAMTYTVAGRDAGAILHLITSRLRHAELLAAIYVADADLCRIVRSQIDDEVVAFATLLQREKTYPKAQAMLDRLPALNRLIEAQPIGSTCP